MTLLQCRSLFVDFHHLIVNGSNFRSFVSSSQLSTTVQQGRRSGDRDGVRHQPDNQTSNTVSLSIRYRL